MSENEKTKSNIDWECIFHLRFWFLVILLGYVPVALLALMWQPFAYLAYVTIPFVFLTCLLASGSMAPYDCKHCGKKLKAAKSVCHHCGRENRP